MRRMVLLVALIAALTGAARAAAGMLEATDLEAKIGTPYTVMCVDPDSWLLPGAAGYSSIPARVIYLRATDCGALRGGPTSTGFPDALLAILHEWGHVGWQSRDEGKVECFALWVYRAVARREFGATKTQAQDAYVLALVAHAALPDVYQRGCVTEAADRVSVANGLT